MPHQPASVTKSAQPASGTAEGLSIFSRPNVNRRSFLQIGGWSALALGAAPILAACSSSSKSTTTAPAGGSTSSAAPASFGSLTVQLSWIKNIEFAGEFFADSKGYFKDAGFSTVNLTAGGSAGTSAEAAVATGKALVGLSSVNITAPAILKGAKLKTIGSTYQKNPFCILSQTSKAIKTPQDMVGKKIGVQSGGNETIFEGLLAANGLKKSQLTVVPVQYDPTVATTGEVDGYMAYITNEPLLLEAKGFDISTFLFADFGLPLLAETIVVSQDSIDKDRAKLKAYLVAEIKGWTDAVASPSQSATLAVTDYGKDQKLAQDEQTKEATAQNGLIVTADSKANGMFTVTQALIDDNIKALALTGVTITADQLFDLTLIAEVYKEHPELITAFAAAAGSASPSPSAS